MVLQVLSQKFKIYSPHSYKFEKNWLAYKPILSESLLQESFIGVLLDCKEDTVKKFKKSGIEKCIFIDTYPDYSYRAYLIEELNPLLYLKMEYNHSKKYIQVVKPFQPISRLIKPQKKIYDIFAPVNKHSRESKKKIIMTLKNTLEDYLIKTEVINFQDCIDSIARSRMVINIGQVHEYNLLYTGMSCSNTAMMSVLSKNKHFNPKEGYIKTGCKLNTVNIKKMFTTDLKKISKKGSDYIKENHTAKIRAIEIYKLIQEALKC